MALSIDMFAQARQPLVYTHFAFRESRKSRWRYLFDWTFEYAASSDGSNDAGGYSNKLVTTE